MTLKGKWMLIVASLAASKHSIGGSIVTAGAAIMASPAIGFDPFTWSFAALGAVVGKFKTPTTTRTDTAMNGIISVVLGGLGAPFVIDLIRKYEYPAPSVYLLAFGLAIVWPFVLKEAVKYWNKRKAND